MTDGTCYLCGDRYTKRGMTRHLRSCKRADPANVTIANSAEYEMPDPAPTYHLVVSADNWPDHWLHLSVESDATLSDLDAFLRAIWLECCDHLSAFEINGTRYERAGFDRPRIGGPERRTMDVPIADAIQFANEIVHEYDFGSMNRQTIRVADAGPHEHGPMPDRFDRIGVYARNQLPEISCVGEGCDETATTVCWNHMVGPGSDVWFCDACVSDHDCEDHWQTPIPNSPRVGLCGFDGASLTDWSPL